jgi:diguanylate cyclase (GGDEF)-like protein/PAS domain S-box-containing protein
MKNSGLTKAQLIRRIEELEQLNDQLLLDQQRETMLDFSWAGNLGHWYWDKTANRVTFNPMKVKALGFEAAEIPATVDYQFFTSRIHPDDYQPTMDAMLDHLYGRKPVYEAEYRIRHKDGSYKWFYDRGVITRRDDAGKPAFIAGIVFDITAKKALEIELEAKNRVLADLSATDALTGLSNHRTLYEVLGEILQKKPVLVPVSIIMLDIDDFKRINDTKGHIFGDTVLKRIGRILKESVRPDDTPGRYGGEEFLLILPGTDLENALKVAERVRQTIEKTFLKEPMPVTISAGVREHAGESITEFIHLADLNLYKAKQTGKNRVI